MSPIETVDLDAHLERLRAMCIIGSTSDADGEHLRSMLYEMCEMVERAQAEVSKLAQVAVQR